MARRTKRIYFGPEGRETSMWWTVKISDAKQPVEVAGSVVHALKGSPGVTVGCGLSNMAIDKANADAFPHPVYLASFTKSTALLVDKLRADGSPCHAVFYAHSYGHITEKNDQGTLRKIIKDDPSIIERSFTLRPPRKPQPSGQSPGRTSPEGKGTLGKDFVPRGALARAVKAGRIAKAVAAQISETIS